MDQKAQDSPPRVEAERRAPGLAFEHRSVGQQIVRERSRSLYLRPESRSVRGRRATRGGKGSMFVSGLSSGETVRAGFASDEASAFLKSFSTAHHL